jgi:hypothetical protein
LYGDRGYLLGSRFDIIAKTVDHVTETWDRSRGIGVPSDAVLYYRRTLEKIALASISSNDIDPGHMPRRWLLEQLRDNEGLERVGADSEEFLRWISARTDILIEHSVKSGSQVWYGFSHLVFAEYLAASRLVRIGGSIDGTLRLLINLPERYLPGLATLTAQALSRGRDLTSQLVPALTTMIENAQSPAELRRSFVIARALADAWPVSEDENKLVLRSARRMQDKFELKEALILKQDNKRRD